MKTIYMMKVRFSDHASANKIKEEGIYLFKLYVAPWQIEFERFTPVRQCMNCYAYGHLKSSCKEEKKTRCSECGSGTHTYRTCTSAHKKCLNCGGAHRTFANSCPTRKDAIKTSQEKEKEREKEKENKPLKAVAQKTAQATVQATTNAWKPLINQVRQDIRENNEKNKTKVEPTVHLALPNNLSKEILVVLLHAHLQNLINPERGFREHAREALRRNNLPELDLGEADSWGILKVVHPPPPPTENKQSETASHVQALDRQIEQISPPTPTNPAIPAPDTSVRSKQQQPTPQGPSSLKRYALPPPLKDLPKETPPAELATPVSADPYEPDENDISFMGDDGQERLMDGTVKDPKFYGIRLFARNPDKYEYSSRYEIGQEIQKGRIKWLFSNEERYNMVIAGKLHEHLTQGNILVTNRMIEKHQDITKIRNGHLVVPDKYTGRKHD